jgi:hypothetical protein
MILEEAMTLTLTGIILQGALMQGVLKSGKHPWSRFPGMGDGVGSFFGLGLHVGWRRVG